MFKRFKAPWNYIVDIKIHKVMNIQTKRQGILFVFITDRKKDSQMRHDYHHEVLGLGLTNFGDALKGGTRSEAPGQMNGQTH